MPEDGDKCILISIPKHKDRYLYNKIDKIFIEVNGPLHYNQFDQINQKTLNKEKRLRELYSIENNCTVKKEDYGLICFGWYKTIPLDIKDGIQKTLGVAGAQKTSD